MKKLMEWLDFDKPLYKSTAIIGILIGFVGTMLRFYGIEIDLGPLADGGTINEFLQIIGAALSLFGIRLADARSIKRAQEAAEAAEKVAKAVNDVITKLEEGSQ